MAHLLIVDGANVVGSRPDGWWRDRLGAAARLRDQLTGLAGRDLPGLGPVAEVVLVVEGAARTLEGIPTVRVAATAGSGDDLVVALVAERAAATGPVAVVTADRRLRQRVGAAGATVRGPRWLTDQLDRRQVESPAPAPAPAERHPADPLDGDPYSD